VKRAVLAVILLAGWGASRAPADNLISTNRPAAEPTVVTSERLNVDYANNRGTFEGNVLVVDPRITLRADKIIVQFGDAAGAQTNSVSRSVKKIEASGGVVITAEEKKAVSEHAIYTADDGKIILTGNPQVETPEGTVAGSKITFWRDEKKMDVESSTRLVLYPEDPAKKSPPPADSPTPEPNP